jgi:hypothetical protein
MSGVPSLATFTLSAEYLASLRNAGQLTGRIDYVHQTAIQFDSGNSH